MKTENYDVIILGTGIAGTILGTILARAKLNVVLIDRDSHPKFAIGESTIPQTSAMMRVLAERYQIPEFYHLSSFQNINNFVTKNCGMKRNFGFVYHHQKEGYSAKRCHQLGALRDVGLKTATEAPTESHLFRQDVDAYVLQLAIKYGCKVYQNTQVTQLEITKNEVTIETNKNLCIKAKYIVDGTGYNSFLSKEFGLRVEANQLRTHSRTIFTHMLGVKNFDDCIPASDNPWRPAKWSQGTLHHVFNGGWLWVIPFNNHRQSTNPLCSVGLQLDTRLFPKTDITPEKEFFDFINHYPTIKHQFSEAKPFRNWVGMDRIQYSASASVGHRYCLLSHAMGFIDPLYSRGLSNTLEIINLAAKILINAIRENDFSLEKFEIIDTVQQGLVYWNDRLVNASYIAFRNYELWNAWFRVWGLIQPLGIFRIDNAHRKFKQTGNLAYLDILDRPIIHGALTPDHPEYMNLLEKALAVMDAVENNELCYAQATKKIFNLIEAAQFLPPHFPYANSNITFGSESVLHRYRKHNWFIKQSKQCRLDQRIE